MTRENETGATPYLSKWVERFGEVQDAGAKIVVDQGSDDDAVQAVKQAMAEPRTREQLAEDEALLSQLSGPKAPSIHRAVAS